MKKHRITQDDIANFIGLEPGVRYDINRDLLIQALQKIAKLKYEIVIQPYFSVDKDRMDIIIRPVGGCEKNITARWSSSAETPLNRLLFDTVCTWLDLYNTPMEELQKQWDELKNKTK